MTLRVPRVCFVDFFIYFEFIQEAFRIQRPVSTGTLALASVFVSGTRCQKSPGRANSRRTAAAGIAR